MKKHISIFIFTLTISLTFKAQDYVWAKSFGSTANDRGRSLQLDAAGNVYLTGSYVGIVDFDPGPGTATIETIGIAGNNNIFIAKYDNSGNFLWVKNIGGPDYEAAYCIHLDPIGNIYISGYFKSAADFDPGPGSTILNAGSPSGDIFIAKYDNNGNNIWAKSFVGNAANSNINPAHLGRFLKTDASGNVFVTGYFSGTVDFDPGPGTATLASKYYDDIDCFLAKYNSSGDYQWAKQIKGKSDNYLTAQPIDIDNAGNVYLTGGSRDTISFDQANPNAITIAEVTGSSFIAKYNPAGNFLWAKHSQGTSGCWAAGYAIQLDASNNIYLAGTFYDNVDLDSGPGTAAYGTVGGRDMFYAKYDNNGNHIWSKTLTGTVDHIGAVFSLIVDSYNIYMMGYLYSETDFDPSVNTATIFANSGASFFIAKYDISGNYIWAKSLGANNYEEGLSMDIDAGGNAYCTGYFFNSTADFDFGVGTQTLACAGGADIFLAKYGNVAIGLNELENDNSIYTIFPNPSSGQFYLEGNKNLNALEIEVSDISGRLIYKRTAKTEKIFIDLKDKSKGIYFLKAYHNKELVLAKKVIVE